MNRYESRYCLLQWNMRTYDIHALDVSAHLVGLIVHFSDHLQFAFGVKIKRWAFRLHINFKTHYVSHRTWVSYKRRELLTLGELIVLAPVFVGVCVAHLFSYLCCVFCILFVFVLCLVCPMLPMSLDCPFGFLWRLFTHVTLLGNCVNDLLI